MGGYRVSPLVTGAREDIFLSKYSDLPNKSGGNLIESLRTGKEESCVSHSLRAHRDNGCLNGELIEVNN